MRRLSGRSHAVSGSSIALALLLLLALVAQCSAQLNNLPTSVGNINDATTTSSSSSDDSTSTDATSTDDQSTTSGNAKTTTSSGDKTTSTSAETTSGSAKVSLLKETSTSSSSTSSQNSKETSSGIFHLSNLPTIAGATNPTQVVPYTANAPFMRKSDLPEGTVFIIVGAILGFFGACVLAWRGLVAWSLSRSVKRAARAQQQTFDLKSHAYPAPSAGMYGVGPPGSSASMEKFNVTAPKASRLSTFRPKSSHGAAPSQFSGPGAASARGSMQNLFFSPTAGAGHHSMTPSPRPSSTFLPAGYYAAGASQAAGGSPTTHINAHAANRGSSLLNPLTDRLSGIRAENAGYHRTNSFGPSPPGSPALGPIGREGSPMGASSVVGQVSGPTAGSYHAQSTPSHINLGVPGGTTQGGRTPSAYLEEMFENHGSGGPQTRF